MTAYGQFRSRPHFNDRHDVMVYRSADSSAPANKPVAKDYFASRMERQVCLPMEMYLFWVEFDLMGQAIAYRHPLVEVVLASSQQGEPYPVSLIYDGREYFVHRGMTMFFLRVGEEYA